jgi:hypothetical protein
MTAPPDLVWLVDVDNTLLDNDAAERDYHSCLREQGGPSAAHYWAIFEALRREEGFADYLGALQRYRRVARYDPRLLLVSSFLLDYPFADRVFPDALQVLAWAGRQGLTAILSDGDVVFQPRKILRAGLAAAVGGRVLVTVHKERELNLVERWFPAARYILVDDKLRILTAVKEIWGPRVTTVFVRQGRYARDPGLTARYPPADLTVERIGDLLRLDLATAPRAAGTAG